jgi:hypothetical protein
VLLGAGEMRAAQKQRVASAAMCPEQSKLGIVRCALCSACGCTRNRSKEEGEKITFRCFLYNERQWILMDWVDTSRAVPSFA